MAKCCSLTFVHFANAFRGDGGESVRDRSVQNVMNFKFAKYAKVRFHFPTPIPPIERRRNDCKNQII